MKDRKIICGILIANEVVDDVQNLKRSCCYLKWILKKLMILLTGLFKFCDGENVVFDSLEEMD